MLLDTPGGIKIQTIHSFCQEILKRFPLEAGISPYFEIMDDRAAAEAGEEIKNRLIAEIRGNPGSPAAEAMAFLTENVSELKFPEIIGTIINERGKSAGCSNAGHQPANCWPPRPSGWALIPTRTNGN